MRSFCALLLVLALSVGTRAGTVESVLFTRGDGVTRSTNSFKSALLALIAAATSTIDVAVYNLRDADVIAALNTAKAAGRTVRVVTDDENNVSGHPIKTLVNITVVDDAPSSLLMHNKFVITDAALSTAAVWMGSANFTSPSFSAQNNNALIIRDQNVAAAYTTEFNRLFVSKLFHSTKTVSPNVFVMSDGTEVEVRFSPGMTMQTRYTQLVDAASDFYWAIYTFGSSTIGNNMIANKAKTHFGLFEGDFQTQTQFDALKAAGMTVAHDVNPAEMHHKFLVAGTKIVATGSYNFTVTADDSNDENVVILRNNAGISDKYVKEINRIATQNLRSLGAGNFEDTSAPSASTAAVVVSSSASPGGKILHGPNPMRLGSGSMTFTSSSAGVIRKIEILDIVGRVVHTIIPTSSATSATWDGKNNRGAFIASGMYFYRVDSGGKAFTGRFSALR